MVGHLKDNDADGADRLLAESDCFNGLDGAIHSTAMYGEWTCRTMIVDWCGAESEYVRRNYKSQLRRTA